MVLSVLVLFFLMVLGLYILFCMSLFVFDGNSVIYYVNVFIELSCDELG